MPYCFYVEIMVADCALRRELLSSGRTIIGRSPHSCAVIVPDRRVSRVHLRVHYSDDTGVSIMDMYSANGSLLEGRPLYPGWAIQWLLDQVVSIGYSHLVLRYGKLDS